MSLNIDVNNVLSNLNNYSPDQKKELLNLLEEYEKYRFDMLEQGLEPMSLEQFRREALAGMAKAKPEEVEEIKERKVISLAGGGIPELLEG